MKIQTSALIFLLSTSTSVDQVAAFGISGLSSQSSPSSFVVRKPSPTQHTYSSWNKRTIPFTQPSHSQHSTQTTALSMLATEAGGMEELKLLAKEGDKTIQTARKSPTLFKVGGYAAVPISAVLGAVMTPSRRLAVNVVGSAITGVAGYIGKNRLDAATEAAAKPALAQLLVDEGIDNPDVVAEQVNALQDTFGVDDEDFSEICVAVYKRYLMGMVKMPITKTSEMKELSNLRKTLNLTNLSVGEAHAAAAKEFYRQTCLFTPPEDLQDPDHPDRMSIDKFLFLSERVFRQGGETPEAFKYEMSRVAKAFEVTLEEALERVAEIAEPFYSKALESTRAKIDQEGVSAELLQRAKKSLGISDSTAFDMHITTFSDEVRELLGKKGNSEEDVDMATLKFADGAEERLAKIQKVFSLEDRDADYEISVEATPLFQAKALKSMTDAINKTITPEKAWNEMKDRQSELLLKDDSMKELLASIVMQALGKPLEETMSFAKVNNEAATYERLLDALEAKESCLAVLQQSGWEEYSLENFDKKFLDPYSKSSACGFLSSSDRLRLYKIFLTRAVRKSEDGKQLTEENYEKVKEVQQMLGISDAEEANQFRANFGPELRKTLSMAMYEIMGDDYTPALVTNLKEMIDKVVSDYKLPAELIAEYASPLYMRAVTAVSDETPSGVPTKEKMEQLNALRDLLLMSKEDTYPAHLEVFGSAYKTGVLESMGSTGIIRKELRAPLEELRSRLGVSDEAGKQLYLDAVKERMIPMVEYIVLELERTMLTAEQLSRKRQKDFGEDYFKTGKGADGKLGLGAEANIMTDIMNLIDFYTENDVAEKKQVGTKTVEEKVKEGEEEKTVKKEVPVYETTYPITALDAKAVEPEIADLLYRQFVVGGFTNQGKQGQRYEAARETFGGILGLTKEKMNEVVEGIGGQVYENYIGQSMRTKGALDQQDMMFLANIQGKLNISSEASEKLLLDTQKKILSEEADSLNGEDVDPDAIKAFREKCNSMGMDLETDIGLSKARLSRMFEAEVSPGLVNGDITIESGDLLSEIQDSLGLTSEEAEKIFEGILDKRAKAAISRMRAEILRGREDNCVDIVQRLLRYAQFVNGELGLTVDESTAWKIYNLYDKMDFDGQDKDEVQNNKELLKTTLGLS